MSRMEKSIVCSYQRKLPPKMYAGTIYLPTRISPISSWEATRGKRALLCGVTYTKTKLKLRGSVNDVINMRDLLIDHFQFPCTSICILAETEGHHLPTRKNIEEAMQWLVKDCQSGDSLVFYFSGHGLWQPDFDFDESDVFGESLFPLDFITAGVITDDGINDTIVRPLRKGVILHAIIDASYSGTILDLPRIYEPKDKCWVYNSPSSGSYKGTCGGLAISLADHQSAQDASAFSESRKAMQGAMTSNFVRAVKENPGVTYGGLLASMQPIFAEARNKCCSSLKQVFTQGLKRQEQQEILLSSSEEFNIDEQKFRL